MYGDPTYSWYMSTLARQNQGKFLSKERFLSVRNSARREACTLCHKEYVEIGTRFNACIRLNKEIVDK